MALSSCQVRSETISEEVRRKCQQYENAHQEFLESFFGETIVKVLLNNFPPSSSALSIHDFLYILEGYSVPEHHFDKRHDEASLRKCPGPVVRNKSDSTGDSIDSAYYETMLKLGVSYDDFEGPLSPAGCIRSSSTSQNGSARNDDFSEIKITPTATRLLKGTTRQPVIAKRNANIDMMISAANLNTSKPTSSTASPPSPLPALFSTSTPSSLLSPKASSLLSPKASTVSALTNHCYAIGKNSKNGAGNNNDNGINKSTSFEQPLQSPTPEEQQNSMKFRTNTLSRGTPGDNSPTLVNSSSCSNTDDDSGRRAISECLCSPKKDCYDEKASSILSPCPPMTENQPAVVASAANSGGSCEQALNSTNKGFSKNFDQTDLSTRSRSSSRSSSHSSHSSSSSSALGTRGRLSLQETRRRHIDELLLLRKVVIDSFS